MSLMDVDVSDAQEPICLPENSEAELRIVRANVNQTGEYLVVFFDIPNEPLAKTFSNPFAIPGKIEGRTEKELNNDKWRLKVFYDTFKVDYSQPFDPSDYLPGHTGWAILGVKASEEYGDQNFIKRFVTGA